MTPCGPIHKNFLRLAALDPATETKLKGVVEQLKLVPPTGGKPVAYLVMKSGQDTVQVFLCPKSFLDEWVSNRQTRFKSQAPRSSRTGQT